MQDQNTNLGQIHESPDQGKTVKSRPIRVPEPAQSWEEIAEEYSNEQYPPFGGPFTDSLSLIEWLKINFNPPTRKK